MPVFVGANPSTGFPSAVAVTPASSLGSALSPVLGVVVPSSYLNVQVTVTSSFVQVKVSVPVFESALWSSFHPSGTSPIFTSASSGTVYVPSFTGLKSVTAVPLAVAVTPFSSPGSALLLASCEAVCSVYATVPPLLPLIVTRYAMSPEDGLSFAIFPSTSQPVAFVSISSGAPIGFSSPVFEVGILPATVSSADSLTP